MGEKLPKLFLFFFILYSLLCVQKSVVTRVVTKSSHNYSSSIIESHNPIHNPFPKPQHNCSSPNYHHTRYGYHKLEAPERFKLSTFCLPERPERSEKKRRNRKVEVPYFPSTLREGKEEIPHAPCPCPQPPFSPWDLEPILRILLTFLHASLQWKHPLLLQKSPLQAPLPPI